MEAIKNKIKLLPNTIKIISSIGVVLTLLGIADTIYLTISHFSTKVILACPDTGFINCAKVTTSSYSEIFGIPVAILGLMFFIGMLFFQLPMTWASHNRYIRDARLGYSITGLIAIFWFVYVELHRLNSICLYCTGVHILVFCLFVLTVIGTSMTAVSNSTDE